MTRRCGRRRALAAACLGAALLLLGAAPRALRPGECLPGVPDRVGVTAVSSRARAGGMGGRSERLPVPQGLAMRSPKARRGTVRASQPLPRDQVSGGPTKGLGHPGLLPPLSQPTSTPCLQLWVGGGMTRRSGWAPLRTTRCTRKDSVPSTRLMVRCGKQAARCASRVECLLPGVCWVLTHSRGRGTVTCWLHRPPRAGVAQAETCPDLAFSGCECVCDSVCA